MLLPWGVLLLSPLSPVVLAQNREEETNIWVYEQTSPAVVFLEGKQGHGSGSIIRADGLILTNAHLVDSEQNVRVILADGRRLQAKVIRLDRDLDLALLQIPSVGHLPTLPLASGGSVRVGQRVFAIGNPFGQFQGTFTTGIVSRLDSEQGFIQTDAAINPGNSGGPLLNSQGELIGVNTAIYTHGGNGGNVGINFAIALDSIQTFLATLPHQTPSRRASPRLLTLNGEARPGRLTPQSQVLTSDNSFYNVYAFQGQAGMDVEIVLRSGEFDAYLILVAPDGRHLDEDDDSAGGRDARIVAQLPEDGVYLILANAARPKEVGRYTLEVSAVQASPFRPRLQSAAGFLILVEGVLSSDTGGRLQDGSLYREYSFLGQAGQVVTVHLASPDFDPYVIVMDSQGRKLAENHNLHAKTTDSGLTVRLPITDRYRVLVNAYDPRGEGRYVLRVR
ncbi:trypsin-like peptidase domain-containing protein [Spirulina subsalsa FACHB-351]|uniref:Trypsin-like peptidase domain-containing protein n=1 Tax=Spirulina subsalsa FACHB-351 TaxID=234711 RepID=A0ABT3LBB7_9CYAN|nr:trypsin-like peptidase domain-containing protein [Spirulina subsalsa FACHB-351]